MRTALVAVGLLALVGCGDDGFSVEGEWEMTWTCLSGDTCVEPAMEMRVELQPCAGCATGELAAIVWDDTPFVADPEIDGTWHHGVGTWGPNAPTIGWIEAVDLVLDVEHVIVSQGDIVYRPEDVLGEATGPAYRLSLRATKK